MTETKTVEVTFQEQVRPWLLACFGEMIAGDREERNHRFLEEALELVQACGCTAHEAHQLVDYVYGRTAGELHQEVGGVMVTLAALCLANDADMHAAGWVELDRIWGKVEAIRAKQAAKPKHSPLPQHVASQSLSTDEEVRRLRKQVEEARDILSGLSSFLGAGLGDDGTTVGQFDQRIRWGIDHIGSVYRTRAAEVVEECSKRPGTRWGQVKRAILDDTALPCAVTEGAALQSKDTPSHGG